MTTAQEVEEHANRIAMLGMGQSVVLLRQYADLIKTHAEAVAENMRLRAAMDKNSEDEILLIERCAKVCEQVEEEASQAYKRQVNPQYHEGMVDGADNCAIAIRALKEGNEQPAQGMVSEAVVDAERYRWLRVQDENTIMNIYSNISLSMISPALLDFRIDAAREGK